MCYTPQEITEACIDASGGLKRFLCCPQADVISFGALDVNKKVPTITFAEGKRMYEIQFIDEAMSPDGAGGEETDISNINQSVTEFVGTMDVKGADAKQRDYFRKMRGGRHVIAMEFNNGQIFLGGTPFKPAYLRKVTTKFGKKLENGIVQTLEWYYKSKEGLQEFGGTVADLETPGEA